jgi:hypothetical protein
MPPGARGADYQLALKAIDACKTNVRARLFRANFKKCFVSGHDFSRAEKEH